MIRYLKRISKRSNLAACALAVCLFTFITISNFQNDVFNRKTFKKSSYHKKDIFPVAGSGDRIRAQLDFKPNSKKVKTILLLDEHKAWQRSGVVGGKEMFIKKKCPIDSCSLSYNPKTLSKADLVISRGLVMERPNISPSQLWMVYQLESAQSRKYLSSDANWTATYRQDSTLVTPYGWWSPINEDDNDNDGDLETADHIGTKETRIAWFVSNCNANNQRLQYARTLSKFYPVDVFGKCGEFKCSRGKQTDCWQMVAKKYKYYLAFENSNCVDYITEKFWDALKYRVLPIVMGARLSDYESVAPPNSFLHVDNFSGPEELSDFLRHLDQNPATYNSYFQWVERGKFEDSKFLCRVCSLLHYPSPPQFHSDVQDWWSGLNTCVNESWTGRWSL